MRTGPPGQSSHWLPGAGGRLRRRSARQSDDQDHAGNTASTVSDLTDLSAMTGRASFKSGEHYGERGQASVSSTHALLREHLTTEMNTLQSCDKQSQYEGSLPCRQKFFLYTTMECGQAVFKFASSVQSHAWRGGGLNQARQIS
jgi:hypothetical protein